MLELFLQDSFPKVELLSSKAWIVLIFIDITKFAFLKYNILPTLLAQGKKAVTWQPWMLSDFFIFAHQTCENGIFSVALR